MPQSGTRAIATCRGYAIGVYWFMRVVETPVFTKVITGLLNDEDYRRLQIALMLRPEQGPIIRGTGGLRKVRWAKAGAGKR